MRTYNPQPSTYTLFDSASKVKENKNLLGNPKKAQEMADEGRSQVEKYFNWPVLAQQFLKVVSKQSRLAGIGV